MITLESGIKYATQHGEYANLLQYGYSHQDSQEEHNGRQVDTRQQIAYTLGHGVIIRSTVVEDLCNCPKQTQNKQDAHEWRQMSNRLEDGHKAQTAYTQPEDDVALRLGKGTDIGLWQILLLIKLAFQLILQDKGRYQHRNQRWDKDFGQHTLSSNNALNPKHDGGYIANRRECASRVSRDNNQSCIDQSVVTTLNQLTQHHNHHDRCC